MLGRAAECGSAQVTVSASNCSTRALVLLTPHTVRRFNGVHAGARWNGRYYRASGISVAGSGQVLSAMSAYRAARER